MGLYDLSRQRESGGTADLVPSLHAWRRHPGAIGLYAIILLLFGVVIALGGGALMVAGSMDLDELLSQAVSMIRDTFGYFNAAVMLIEDNGERITTLRGSVVTTVWSLSR